MNTKTIGTICELKIITKMVEKGYSVSIPYGENTPYDFIFDDGASLYRVQCKSGTYRNGSVKFRLQSVFYQADIGKFAAKRANKNSIEFYGVYCAELDKCYLVPVSVVGEAQCNLRIDEVLSGQKNGIRFATEFEI